MLINSHVLKHDLKCSTPKTDALITCFRFYSPLSQLGFKYDNENFDHRLVIAILKYKALNSERKRSKKAFLALITDIEKLVKVQNEK